MKLHPVDATLKRRFIESLQARASRLREATHLSRWEEVRREISILRAGGERYRLTELERTGKIAADAVPRESVIFPGLRKASLFERTFKPGASDPSPQIEHLLRAVDAVVAEELIFSDRRSS